MKTKFNPKDVPHWVRWIAVDRDGDCWGFSAKPIYNAEFGNGFEYGKWDTKSLRSEACLLYCGKPPRNPESELYTWG